MDEYYWKPSDFEAIDTADSMQELLKIAMGILSRMPDPIVIVAGPISTGGRGSLSENLKVFAETIKKVKDSGKIDFNQLPFENKFGELDRKAGMPYFKPILDDFFLPIMKSGKISKIYFIEDWQSSTGARWEYEMAEKIGIPKSILKDGKIS